MVAFYFGFGAPSVSRAVGQIIVRMGTIREILTSGLLPARDREAGTNKNQKISCVILESSE